MKAWQKIDNMGHGVQAVQYPSGVYYAFTSDGGRTFWGHSMNVGKSLDEFVARFDDEAVTA